MTHRRRSLLLAGAVVALLAGCYPSADVDAYPAEADTELDCRALVADLPHTIGGLSMLRVDNPTAAAWGDPHVVLRCGVEQPEDLTPTSRCDSVGDVDWFSEPVAHGYLFTTIGRRFFVSVEVPTAYDPATDVLIDLADSLHKHDPVVRPCV